MKFQLFVSHLIHIPLTNTGLCDGILAPFRPLFFEQKCLQNQIFLNILGHTKSIFCPKILIYFQKIRMILSNNVENPLLGESNMMRFVWVFQITKSACQWGHSIRKSWDSHSQVFSFPPSNQWTQNYVLVWNKEMSSNHQLLRKIVTQKIRNLSIVDRRESWPFCDS